MARKQRRPAEGDYVEWEYVPLSGKPEVLVGRVDALLSVQFTLYVEGRECPYFVMYNDPDWRVL